MHVAYGQTVEIGVCQVWQQRGQDTSVGKHYWKYFFLRTQTLFNTNDQHFSHCLFKL